MEFKENFFKADDVGEYISALANSAALSSQVCGFRVDDEAPLESAWLEVTLKTVCPDGAGQPTAWSLEPLTLHDPVEISKVVKLDGSLKLTNALIPVNAGSGGAGQTTSKVTRREPFVEAHREGTARPAWIFSRTQATEIRGAHRLRAAVELPAGAAATCEVSAGAEARLKFLGLVPYRTDLTEPPERLDLG